MALLQHGMTVCEVASHFKYYFFLFNLCKRLYQAPEFKSEYRRLEEINQMKNEQQFQRKIFKT
jgi:hypothetical protein